jgi:protease-4
MLKSMGRFFRYFWQSLTVLRRFLANLILLLMLIFVGVLLFSGGETVPEGAALIVTPRGNIVEQLTEPLPASWLIEDRFQEETLLKDIIDTIDYAGTDSDIQLMVLDLSRMGLSGIGKLQEIGAAVERFKQKGKIVIAAATFFNQDQYYLAAHADRIYLHPMGQVWLSGYGVFRPYFKSALDKLLIQFHVFRVGTYKSALEPFMRDSMSAADREANIAWLNVLWDAYKKEISSLRGIEPERLDDLIRNLDGHLGDVDGDAAQLALTYGLVDDLKTPDEVRRELIQLVGPYDSADAGRENYKQIQFNDYLDIIRPDLADTDPDHAQIGLIFARGMILEGKQPAGWIGAESMVQLIRRARQSESIKAVVLRINSGGGSAMAAEIIRREIELTRESGKPVVVSMSTVAASGGYWIALAADEIWAHPTSLTGSIGIFAALPTLDKSLDAVGIHTDGVGTTPLSGAFDPTRPLNQILARVLQQNIENGYHRFVRRVADARRMDPEAVETVAQGRVWAGRNAFDLGLVDQLGGLNDAIASAARLADLQVYDVVPIQRPLTAKEHLFKQLNRLIGTWLASDPEFDPHVYQTAPVRLIPFILEETDIATILQLRDPQHVYALCLPCLCVDP